MRWGAILLCSAAALQAGAAVVFAGFSLAGLIWAALCALLALGVWRGWRSLAWLALMALPVSIGVAAAAIGTGIVPNALRYVLILVQAAAVAMLFVALWRPRAAVSD